MKIHDLSASRILVVNLYLKTVIFAYFIEHFGSYFEKQILF